LGPLVSKVAGGPVSFLYAAMVLVAAYAILDRCLEAPMARKLLTPIRTLGSKGLPGYAALQVTVLLLDTSPRFPRTDTVILAVVTVCGLTEYLAVRLQQRRKRTRTKALVTRPVDDAPVTSNRPQSSEEPARHENERHSPWAAGLSR
jgi:hypothetical protein